MLKQITISQIDIEKHNIQNSDSGYIIDELAYACDQWTSNDLYDNNVDYEPTEPYMYDFEDDLFKHTVTQEDLVKLAKRLDVECVLGKKTGKLQAGAYFALHNPSLWAEMLKAWEEALRSQDIFASTDLLFSKEYAKELEEAKASYHDDMYKEWLNGDRDYKGVIREIALRYTDEVDGSFDEKRAEYTFNLNENDIASFKEAGYRSNQMKKALLDSIKRDSDNRKYREKIEREKRAEENKKTKAYKDERARIGKEACYDCYNNYMNNKNIIRK